jgi:hypothetical protein
MSQHTPGPYWTAKTLLVGEPDTNGRQVYGMGGSRLIASFNSEMREWTEEDEANLRLFLDALKAASKR